MEMRMTGGRGLAQAQRISSSGRRHFIHPECGGLPPLSDEIRTQSAERRMKKTALLHSRFCVLTSSAMLRLFLISKSSLRFVLRMVHAETRRTRRKAEKEAEPPRPPRLR